MTRFFSDVKRTVYAVDPDANVFLIVPNVFVNGHDANARRYSR